MTVIVFLCVTTLCMALLVVWFLRRNRNEKFVKISAEQLPQTGVVNRYDFDKQLLDRTAAGRFSLRECTMLHFRFRTEETGVGGAIVDLLMQRVAGWPIEQDFILTKVAEDGFAVLVEDVALPDESQQLEDLLHVFLDLPMSGSEQNALEFTLVHGSFPYATDNVADLWGLVVKRLNQQQLLSNTLVSRANVEVRDDGVLVINLGRVEGVSYSNVQDAFQIFVETFAPHYPGVKFPQLCKAERVLSLDPGAIRFTRSKAVAEVMSAVAVAPRGGIEKHLMRMYAYYNQPPYPFKVCDSEEQAIEWLQKYVDPQFFELHKQVLERQTTPKQV